MLDGVADRVDYQHCWKLVPPFLGAWSAGVSSCPWPSCILMAGWWLQHDWWNLLDFVVVTVSILAIPMRDVQGFNLLRMMRVFRVRCVMTPFSLVLLLRPGSGCDELAWQQVIQAFNLIDSWVTSDFWTQ